MLPVVSMPIRMSAVSRIPLLMRCSFVEYAFGRELLAALEVAPPTAPQHVSTKCISRKKLTALCGLFHRLHGARLQAGDAPGVGVALPMAQPVI